MRTGTLTLTAALPAALLAALLSACAYYQDESENRVLAVGIDKYDYVNDLYACVSDARAVAATVSADIRSVIAGENGSKTVTKDMVLAAVRDAAEAAPSGGYGVFVFHYSGHGDPSKGGILLMGDVTMSFAPNTVITTTELLAAVAAVPADVRVVILDSCYSGLFVDTGAEVSALPGDGDYGLLELVSEAADRFNEASSGDLIVMTAAGAAELSQESSGPGAINHGYFTMGLLESAKHGDENDDGLVTLTETYAYAAEYVAEVFNLGHPNLAYYPRLSGSALDLVLFRTGER
jgi:uncharacterized caspase-like protein